MRTLGTCLTTALFTIAGVCAETRYVIVGTGQSKCYDNRNEIAPSKPGQPFYGQDAQFQTHPASYTVSADGLTVLDNNTGLTWQRRPDTDGDGVLNRADKLTLAQAQARPAKLNAAKFGGFGDWRLPNAKELQSIVDYTKCPDTTGSPAISPLFQCTAISNEIKQTDYPYYWTGTTHATAMAGGNAVYIAFGRAAGWPTGMPGQGGGPGRDGAGRGGPGQGGPGRGGPPPGGPGGPRPDGPGMGGRPDVGSPNAGAASYHFVDVHGAGAQRSDPKTGDAAAFPHGHGPQGDVIRINNFVRLVRDSRS